MKFCGIGGAHQSLLLLLSAGKGIQPKLYRTIICVNVNEPLLKDLRIEANEERASKGNMVICDDKGIKNDLREECLSGRRIMFDAARREEQIYRLDVAQVELARANYQVGDQGRGEIERSRAAEGN